MQTQEKKKRDITLNNSLRLLLSTDKLFIPLVDNITSIDDLELLLDGKDNDCTLIEGDADVIYDVISLCYNARESGNIVTIGMQGGLIEFR